MKKLSVLLLVLVLVLALASCGVIELPANEDFADAALKAAYEVTEFEVSEDFKLANTVTDAAGHTYNVVWTSSDERVLAVTNGEKEATVKVTPSYFGEMVVILTGTITEGEVTAEVKLTYTVPGVTCTHEYEITRTEEPNCGVDGLQAYRCKHCGRQYMETLFATGAHDYQLTEVVAPAATSHGYTLYTCTVCEQTKTEDTTHAFVYEYSYADPTCTEEGLHLMICYVCATKGVLNYDENDPATFIIIPATGHDFSVEVEVVAPGCGANGYTVYGCANCDATENRDEVPATSTHDFSVFVETVAPTCTSDGYTTYKCANCEATENRDTVTGAHDFSVLVATVAPTCTVDGYTTYKCANCEATENRDTVTATGEHVFINGVCKCGEEYDEEVVIAWVLTTELKDGDLVLIGNPAYGKLLSAEKVDATSFYNKGVDYSADDFSNVTDSEIFVVTVNADGTYTFTSLTGKVIALAASYASLNDTGVNKSWALVAQGDDTFLMKNTGRNTYLEWYASKNNWSTYTAGNDPQYYLSFYVKTVTIASDHAHNHITEVTAPTCTEAGYTTYTCACGDTYEKAGEAATGVHVYVNGECACGLVCEHTGGTATCQAKAVCTVCGASYGDKADHVWGADDACTTPGCEETKPAAGDPVLAGKADFSSVDANSSYSDRVTANGWTAQHTAVQGHKDGSDTNPNYQVIPEGEKAFCLTGNVERTGKLVSPTLTGGIKKLTFTWAHIFSDTNISFTIIVTDLATGQQQTKTIEKEFADGNDQKMVPFDAEFILDTAITGDFTIEIVNNNPSQAVDSGTQKKNKDRVSIWNLEWYK